MWIVRLALRRPYTFVVAAVLILILGIFTIFNTPTDIFPDVKIPVIAVVFNYNGMSADDLEKHVTTLFERILTTTVNDVEHSESQALTGIAVVKIYFQPNVKIDMAMSQVSAICQTAIRSMPPGIQPPLVIQYNASDVPILQLAFSSDTVPEQRLFDEAINTVRPRLITVHGVQIPYPYGGKQRQVMVDLDPERLYAEGVSPSDVSAVLGNQNLILPAGTAKIGKQEYPVMLNNSPVEAADLNELPIKTVNGAPVYLKDVGHARDGFQVQQSLVHVGDKRGVLLSIMKTGGASTLDVIAGVQRALRRVMPTLPKGLKVAPLFDQSVYVRSSIDDVVREGTIAAALTALMVLIFLGSWRSTIVVVTSIPLSILVSIIVMSALGQTLNVMTIGGLALAVGILVDDATVEIENIHRNLHEGKRLVKAILDGASQIAVPAFVSTLCICIVFVPVLFISGSAKYLFVPLAGSVVFAMATSYLLSRTLVPTMVHYLLASEVELYGGKIDTSDPHADPSKAKKADPRKRTGLTHWIWVLHEKFDAGFEKVRTLYGSLLAWSLQNRMIVVGAFALMVASGVAIAAAGLIGRDFFPTVDAGQIRLHVRARPGTRIEETERIFAAVETVIHADIPSSEIQTMLDDIGIPNSSINLALSDGSLMSSADGEILIALKKGHRPSEGYMDRIYHDLRQKFPDLTFFFAPADIVTQVLNFGISAPIDIQVEGSPQNRRKDFALANRIAGEVQGIVGAADVRLQQVPNTPTLFMDVDRTQASYAGLTQHDVANDMLISLSGTAQQNPNFWEDPKNGVQYNVLAQTPQYDMDSINALENEPVLATSSAGLTVAGAQPELLGTLAQLRRGVSATNITHYNPRPTYDVLAGVRGIDLESVAKGVERIVAKERKGLEPGTSITVRGQVQSMQESFTGLSYGLIFAVILVYLLMVINFQSWLDPLIILMALPGALSGILWMLFVTQTTLSVPSLMGAIMSIGVAISNSILIITFANDHRLTGANAHDAALEAGMTRLRPVIMTALAMIIGMLPMALGLGEGGEQNAPLGRAVIGGLILATFATLFLVPVAYSRMRAKPIETRVEEELRDHREKPQ